MTNGPNSKTLEVPSPVKVGHFQSTEEQYQMKLDAMAVRAQERVERFIANGDKERVIGLDMTTLARQIEEKASIVAEQKRQNDILEKSIVDGDTQRNLMHLEKETVRREIALEIRELNQEAARNKQPSDYLKKDLLPPRVGDDDPRCRNLTNGQQFAGEDLSQPFRIARQREQFRADLDQQKYERAMLKEQEKEDERVRDQTQKAMLAALENVEQVEKGFAREVKGLSSDYNQDMVARKKREAADVNLNQYNSNSAANALDLKTHLDSEFLSESGAALKRNGEPLLTEFKGLPKSAHEAAFSTYQGQAAAHVQAVKDQEKEAWKFAVGYEADRNSAIATQQAQNVAKRDAAGAAAEINKHLAARQGQTQKEWNDAHKFQDVDTKQMFHFLGKSAR